MKNSTELEPTQHGEIQADITDKPHYDILIGHNDESKQYGLLGEAGGRKVALDLNQPQVIVTIGSQGVGKSNNSGSIMEMSIQKLPGINLLKNAQASVVFHFSETQTYASEFCSMIHPNDNLTQVKNLLENYGAQPSAVKDIIMLAPLDKVKQRQLEHPNMQVRPLQFPLKQLHASHLMLLIGAAGNESTYLRFIKQLIKQNRDHITLKGLQEQILHSDLKESVKESALMRLDFAEQFICEDSDIHALLKPGRMIIVDIRDELIEKNEALGLFMVLLKLFSETHYNGKPFNKVIMFDECHKYINNRLLVDALTEAVREMRHRGTSVILASQDPQSIPTNLIELASILMLHKFNSPRWLKHMQEANSALKNLSPEKLSTLNPGEAYIWANKATDIGFTRQANKIMCRPRVTKHGGDTLTAIR